MLFEHEGRSPQVHPTARVAPNATVCGDVVIGPNCSVGFGAVLVAESGPIRVGANCVIMDTAVLRGVRSASLTLGDNVLVGPRAYLTGCIVEDDAFLATGCTVFNGARIGRGAEVRINGIVHLRTALPPHATVPLGWIAVGDPAHILPPTGTMLSGPCRSRLTFRVTCSAWSGRRKGRRSCRTSCRVTPAPWCAGTQATGRSVTVRPMTEPAAADASD